MQDPRFCSACGAGPFVHIQNHLNKCKESRKQELVFLDTSRGVKRRDFAPDMEVLRRRRQPPDLTPQVPRAEPEEPSLHDHAFDEQQDFSGFKVPKHSFKS